MKNFFITIIAVMTAVAVNAQSTATSQPLNFHIEKEVVPPMLMLVDGSLKFNDKNGNNFINANEDCAITFKVCNKGRGDAFGCSVDIKGTGSTDGLSYTNKRLPVIHPNETINVDIPIKASMNTISGVAQFEIAINEPNGFGVAPMGMNIGTRRFESPMVEIVSYKISTDAGQLKKVKSFRVQLLLQNTDLGVAKNITMQMQLPENMFLLEGEKNHTFATLQPNEQKLLDYEFVTNAKVEDEVALAVSLHESWGKYAKDAKIPLHFGQAVSSARINLDIQGEDKEIQITKGSLVSDVDENIPKTNTQNAYTFVVIIANENYQQVASVPFALNDGRVFHQYCEQTLGIPSKNIREYFNATGNQIKWMVNWLAKTIDAYSDNHPNIIFYYAGHGIPDEASKTAYLMPIDGIAGDISTCYKLDDLYAALGNMPAEHISVFMDACFSGSKREQGMLAEARGVALKAHPGQPKGNMVVFSAAQGDETAWPYNAKQHGLFTYYLLKKLQDTKGDVMLKDLGTYITSNVKQQSVLENNKIQTPSVTPASPVANTWQSWKLK